MYVNDGQYRDELPLPPIDEVIQRRGVDPRSRSLFEAAGVGLQDVAPPLAYKLTLPAEACHGVLRILHEQDEIFLANLMPSLDNVTRDLEFRKDRLLPAF